MVKAVKKTSRTKASKPAKTVKASKAGAASPKKRMSRHIRTFEFFVILAALLGMMAGIIMVKVFYSSGNFSAQSNAGDCRVIHEHHHCAGDFVGLSEADAIKKATSKNITYRIVDAAKSDNTMTSDLQEDRINLTVKSGVVTKAEFY